MNLNRDGDGFLVNIDDWSEEVMYQMAESDGMHELIALPEGAQIVLGCPHEFPEWCLECVLSVLKYCRLGVRVFCAKSGFAEIVR